MWNLLCHGHGPHIPATIACLCFSGFAKPQRAQTLRGSSHDQTFPQAFPRQLSQANASNPSAGLSKATLAATRPSHLFLRAFKPAVACPQTLQTLPQAFRRPFHSNCRSSFNGKRLQCVLAKSSFSMLISSVSIYGGFHQWGYPKIDGL